MRPCLRVLPLLLLSAACLTAAPAPLERKPARLTGALRCVLTADAECDLGKVPNVRVAITNATREPFVLVGSLNGSCWKRRYPHTTFDILSPDGKSAIKPVKFCKQVNQLREQDFVVVRPGATFDPFQQIDDSGYFRAHQLCPETFDTPGKYRIRFTYSTAADDVNHWCGTSTFRIDILLRAVPKLTLTSNEVVVEVKQK